VGIRKLGMAHLKGLEKLAVYEIVDADTLDAGTFVPADGSFLVTAIDREFAGAMSGAYPMAELGGMERL
jgi:hypothetical protein